MSGYVYSYIVFSKICFSYTKSKGLFKVLLLILITRVYISVVLLLLLPSAFWIYPKFTPACNRCVAKECLSV